MRAIDAIRPLFRGFGSGLIYSAGMGLLVAFLLALTTIFGDSDIGIVAGIAIGFIQIAPLVVLVTIFYTIVVGIPLAAILRALNLYGLFSVVVSGALSGYGLALWQWPMTEPMLFASCGGLAGAAFWFGCRQSQEN